MPNQNDLMKTLVVQIAEQSEVSCSSCHPRLCADAVLQSTSSLADEVADLCHKLRQLVLALEDVHITLKHERDMRRRALDALRREKMASEVGPTGTGTPSPQLPVPADRVL